MVKEAELQRQAKKKRIKSLNKIKKRLSHQIKWIQTADSRGGGGEGVLEFGLKKKKKKKEMKYGWVESLKI